MPDSPLDAYLATVDPIAARVVTELHEAVVAAAPQLDVAIKYTLLSYAVEADWRTWVCAIGATKKGVSLRFLYGFILDDPLEILRPGSSVLMNWDIAFDGEVDAAAIGTYVTEAVAKYPDYKADAERIQTAARAAHAKPSKRR